MSTRIHISDLTQSFIDERIQSNKSWGRKAAAPFERVASRTKLSLLTTLTCSLFFIRTKIRSITPSAVSD